MKTHPILPFVVTLAFLVSWGSPDAFVGSHSVSALQAQEQQESATSTGEAPTAEQPSAAEESDKPAVEPPVESSEAVALLKKSRAALIAFRSIQADIRQAVVIGDRKLETTGRYLQGTNLKLRLEFEIRLGKHKDALSGSVLQVCDGRTLWTVQRIGSSEKDKPHITRRDVRQILEAARESDTIAENVLVAELGLGGLPALLASLEKSMVFYSVEQKTIRGKDLTIVEGTWNEELRGQFRKLASAAGTPGTDRLPANIPDSVQVYLDPENSLFPRRIVYRKRPPSKDYSRPMVTVAFANIVLNGPIDEKQFEFDAPEGVPQDNITSRYLDKFKPRAGVTPPAGSKPVIE